MEEELQESALPDWAQIKGIIRRFEDTMGKFEHASLQINFGTLDFAEAQKSMRLFAREVIPAFT